MACCSWKQCTSQLIMPDTVENCVNQILCGQPLNGNESEICDFSIADFNAALDSQGIKPSGPPNFKPILGETVTYIVAAVLINESGNVLMIQEAKESCAGKWYLPAGRMEKGESILDAGRREVREETGLNVEFTTLLAVECSGAVWMRFILTGQIVGGTLKTPAEADKESIQAKWIAGDVSQLTLRSDDIVHLIERARMYENARRATTPSSSSSISPGSSREWHLAQLPTLRPHRRLLLRLVVPIRKKATNRLHILVSERTTWHLPMCEVHPTKSVHSTLRRFMIELFGADVAPHRPHGVLSVEHDPSEGADGLCLTLLVVFKAVLEEVAIIAKCVWHEIDDKMLAEDLLHRILHKNSVFQLHIVR